jgi:two-component system OmpR family sensor kinase
MIKVELKNHMFLVQDNGIGIQQENLKRIFERFYRNSDEVGGFGIGLNIVKNVCNKYSLKIDVTSVPNQGTTFIVKFKD